MVEEAVCLMALSRNDLIAELKRAREVCDEIERVMEECLHKPAWPIDACITARRLAGDEATILSERLTSSSRTGAPRQPGSSRADAERSHRSMPGPRAARSGQSLAETKKETP